MIVEKEHVLNARSDWRPAAAVRDSRAESAEISRQMEEFKSRGGVVQKCELGETRYKWDMVPLKQKGRTTQLRYKDAMTAGMMKKNVRFRSQQKTQTTL